MQELTGASIQGLDLALFSAGGKVSSEWAPKLVEAGAVVVDNSSFWRMHDDVPLVVAEVNAEALDGPQRHRRQPELHDDADGGRAQADPRRRRDRAADRLHLPVGLGHRPAARSRSCDDQSRAGAPTGKPTDAAASIPHQIAFNVLPQVENFKDGDDYTTEERKVMAETRKILGLTEDIGISATCVRVPVITGHSESVNVQTRRDLSPEECRELLSAAPGLVVLDDPGDGIYPLAIDAAGRDEVLVGRIRRDPSHERCLNLWVVGDNLRKGAATNAVQVAELLHQRDLVRVPAGASLS